MQRLHLEGNRRICLGNWLQSSFKERCVAVAGGGLEHVAEPLRREETEIGQEVCGDVYKPKDA